MSDNPITSAVLGVLAEDGETLDPQLIKLAFRCDRREEYGSGSEMLIIHDGGILAPYFNWSYCQYDLIERIRVALEKVGYYVEQCTSWYSAVYRLNKAEDHYDDVLDDLKELLITANILCNVGDVASALDNINEAITIINLHENQCEQEQQL